MCCPYRELEISLEAYILDNLPHISIAFGYGAIEFAATFPYFCIVKHSL